MGKRKDNHGFSLCSVITLVLYTTSIIYELLYITGDICVTQIRNFGFSKHEANVWL